MALIANMVVGIVALLHGYFLVLEMFLWEKLAGLRAFGQTSEACCWDRLATASSCSFWGAW